MQVTARTTLAAAALAALCSSLPAQAEPGQIRGPAVNDAFRAVFPGSIQTERLPNDTPGVFTCAMTLFRGPQLPPIVAIGKYDIVTGGFTRTDEAGSLNDLSVANLGLAIEPGRGRYAVFARIGKRGPEIYFAARSQAGIPFGSPVAVTGVAPNSPFLTLGYVGGKLKLFYVAGKADQTIVMQDLDISDLKRPKGTGTPVVVAKSSTAQGYSGATPITGPDGDVEGLLITEAFTAQNHSRILFKPDLDPAHTAEVAMQVAPDCSQNGLCGVNFAGVAGGRILAQAGRRGPPVIADVEVAWLLGDRVKPGGRADIVGAVSSTGPALTVLYLSAGVRNKIKLPAPLDIGHFGLDVSSMTFLSVLQHQDASQGGTLSFRVPNEPSLRLTAALQGLSIYAREPNKFAWTNTAWLTIQ